ncbi:MAG: DUF374 domain-containing protein, partial [Candidatus Eisenbacteria bacterium]|nr:DUF374 domain-containing protein [Candidatus Eisenbacteria bacterium]
MQSPLSPEDLRRARWVGRGGSRLIRALGRTWRLRVIGAEHEAEARAGGGFIYTFWHGRLLPLTYLRRGRGIVVLVSLGRDGEYISQVIHRLGFATVRGSSSRGGLRALLEMARRGRAGQALAFTPDGPRGPRGRVQPGVLITAQRAGIPILPMSVSARPGRFLASWDRMLIPGPFARLALVFGPPMRIAADGAPDAMVA